MKKIIVFDLKNTLVKEDGSWVPNAERLLEMTVDPQVERILYSMNEPWTYQILGQYEETFKAFNAVLLVNKKRSEDLRDLGAVDVLVIGDSETEELVFGRKWGYGTVKVSGQVLLDEVVKFIGEKS